MLGPKCSYLHGYVCAWEVLTGSSLEAVQNLSVGPGVSVCCRYDSNNSSRGSILNDGCTVHGLGEHGPVVVDVLHIHRQLQGQEVEVLTQLLAVRSR